MKQHPIAKLIKANEPVSKTIRKLSVILPQAHFSNLHVRINGKWEVYESDWLKDLFREFKDET